MEVRSFPEFRDIRGRWIAYGGSALVIVGVLFAFICKIELKQDVDCEIVSSSEVKISGYSGIVSAIYAQPVQKVEAGAPLFALTRDLSLTASGEPRQRFDAALRGEQLRAASTQFESKLADLEAQIAAASSRIDASNAAISAAAVQIGEARQVTGESQSKLDRLNSVSKYITADRIEQASNDVHQGKIALAQAVQRREELIADSKTLGSTLTSLNAQKAQLAAAHERELQDIRLRFEQLRQNITVSAPQAGIVTFSSLVQGRSLDASDVAIVIGKQPSAPLFAVLHISSRQRGFVRTGQTIRIKFDAFPYARFGSYPAHIESISNTTIGSKADEALAVAASDPAAVQAGGYYMAWARLSGDTFYSGREPLRILSGMHGTASIVVEKRTIAEWVFEPLFRMIRG
ncbi:HlyD family secretion protein [Paraburkholderia dinghuensis]|uniref:HlyD family efflux transporter periplasmic adaptor subunit n=1 Tax=Paraburkholderia dinghuensis TaxID=2305225 RepID=A0A3N6NMC6_9BURK|nr:HlyD family efflux transporter periplasmic adaptor subunit [Paraburkholderia dinghuensis]RQH00573.1 HlyD family efflux transporter periplasmic adaptor subunit [Paraburkholderia dinghuensis]